jgi:hypothetical protein
LRQHYRADTIKVKKRLCFLNISSTPLDNLAQRVFKEN